MAVPKVVEVPKIKFVKETKTGMEIQIGKKDYTFKKSELRTKGTIREALKKLGYRAPNPAIERKVVDGIAGIVTAYGIEKIAGVPKKIEKYFEIRRLKSLIKAGKWRDVAEIAEDSEYADTRRTALKALETNISKIIKKALEMKSIYYWSVLKVVGDLTTNTKVKKMVDEAYRKRKEIWK